ncbi:MAG TPA: gamma carbonic anhydrase family protein [Thermoanaerobaculia bacterium]|nr:gamma carbonic anhydrase family protein [Thermoanaerobaculia bacterium]
MPVLPFHDHQPKLGARVFVAPGAFVVGDVELGDDVSVWFGTVVRGDVHSVRIGARTNLQDGVIVHVSHRTHPTIVGAGVVVGHQAVLHGCTIEDGALVGIGARVLDGAVVEAGAQVGAGAVVTPGHRVPAGQLALGIPARPVRPLSDAERANIAATSERYVALQEHYRARLGGTA